MEVDRVDPAKATWQRILSVRPGYASYAILRLATRYNASSAAEKQQLELEYVRRRSFGFDVYVLAATLWAFVASAGNIKLRGKPAV
jgi:lipopolysaccharide/colanic/teichoic acid biosynthesis glycosyltransferase